MSTEDQTAQNTSRCRIVAIALLSTTEPNVEFDERESDHIKPWHEGGKTTAANCQMLCKDDNRRKSGK